MRAEVRRGATPSVGLGKIRDVEWKELATRFALGAVVSIVAGIIAKTEGARLGGVFLAFPAILPASLTFVQDKEGSRDADRTAVGAVLGGLALVVFAAVAESLFTRNNSAVVLAAALAAWLVTGGFLYSALALLRPDDCDVRKD